MSHRTYGEYVEDLIKYMNYSIDFIEDMSFEEFVDDPKTIMAVTKCVEVVGEAAKQIPDSFKQRYLEIPWSDVLRPHQGGRRRK